MSLKEFLLFNFLEEFKDWHLCFFKCLVNHEAILSSAFLCWEMLITDYISLYHTDLSGFSIHDSMVHAPLFSRAKGSLFCMGDELFAAVWCHTVLKQG